MIARVVGVFLVFAWMGLDSSGTAFGAADREPVPVPETFDVAAIDAFLESQVRENPRVGLSVAIARDGRVVLARGYGKRDLERGLPVETGTIFPIGSVSKQFTCAAILLLAEDGRLSVHDRVAKYYPELTRAADIALLDLMHHVSGYPDYYPLDFVDRRMKAAIAPDELLSRYAGGALDFEPGSRFSYSNTGYILLGRIAERVAGQPLERILQERIFGPLGMDRTRYEPEAGEPERACGYTSFALGGPERIGPEAAGWLGGAGAVASTPSDLVKWDLALAEGRILGEDSRRILAAARTLSDGRVSQYGCGVGLRVQDGRPVLTHNGAVSGFNAYNAVVPSTRSAVALVCNVDGGLGALPGQLLGLLTATTNQVPKIDGPPAAEMARSLFLELQRGRVDRSRFGEEFNLYLDDAKLAAAAKRLKRRGRPSSADLVRADERGGMEVSVVRLTLRRGSLRALMYRQPDGRVEQFFVEADRP